MKKASSRSLQLAAWAGMIGSALFVVVFLIEGWIRPGYSPLDEYVSALSIGPRGWIQIANFILFGLLLFAFSRGVAVNFHDGKASRWGLILLSITAACYFFSGPFVMDPAGTALADSTLHGTVHGILGGLVFVMMPIIIFIYWRRFRVDPKWQFLQVWSLVLGIICAVDDIIFTIVSKSPDLLAAVKPWIGLIQRSVLVPFMLWVFIFALGMLRQNRHT
jgi:hypothetical protein